MIGQFNRWMQLHEIAKMFGLSEESIKRMVKTHSLPLRRVTPFATPGALGSECVHWLKAQPQVGAPIRSNASEEFKFSKAKKSRNV